MPTETSERFSPGPGAGGNALRRTSARPSATGKGNALFKNDYVLMGLLLLIDCVS